MPRHPTRVAPNEKAIDPKLWIAETFQKGATLRQNGALINQIWAKVHRNGAATHPGLPKCNLETDITVLNIRKAYVV